MIVKAVLEQIIPFPQYNEYEGQVDVLYQGRLLSCMTVLPSAAWDRYHPGEQRRVNLWLERSGPVARLDGPALPMLKERGGTDYEARGKLRAMDGERLFLDAVFPLEVDLDVSAAVRAAIPALTLGDYVRVVGTMRLDLQPDDRRQIL